MDELQNPITDPRMNDYFSALPILVKESIAQSGKKFRTVDEIRSFVNNLYPSEYEATDTAFSKE